MSNKLLIPLTRVESSQIHSIGHDPESNTLAIRFNCKDGPGSLYHYSNFDAEKFAAFSKAESVGSFFYKNIKPDTDAFPFQRINEEDQS